MPRRLLVFNALVVVLGTVLSLSYVALGAKPIVVARVKGKSFELSELNRSVAPYKQQYEADDVDFSTAEGKLALQRLQMQVLQQVVAQELLQQGARKKGLEVSDAEVTAKYKTLVAKGKGSESAFLKSVSRYGWTKNDVMKDLWGGLLEDKFIKQYIAPDKSGSDLDDAVNAWLQKEVQDDVEILFKVDAPSQGGSMKVAEDAAMEYYRKKYGADAANGAQAKATNYGCHVQVDIAKAGKTVKSLGYGGGEVYEID